FDEPTVGMDVTARKLFWSTINELKNRGKTIIFTTHYLQEADDVAERVILFHEGKIVGDGTPTNIKARLIKQSVSFTPLNAISLREIQILAYVIDVYEKDKRVHVLTDNTDLVLATLFEKKLPIQLIEIERGRLEDAFEHLVEQREVI